MSFPVERAKNRLPQKRRIHSILLRLSQPISAVCPRGTPLWFRVVVRSPWTSSPASLISHLRRCYGLAPSAPRRSLGLLNAPIKKHPRCPGCACVLHATACVKLLGDSHHRPFAATLSPQAGVPLQHRKWQAKTRFGVLFNIWVFVHRGAASET